MSPDGRRTFEAEWPELARKLNAFLARKGITSDQREDLVQETGARLVGMWNSVDLRRSTWALTCTIALNLVRDRCRRDAGREIVSELPDLPATYDLERAGLARVELVRIKNALERLTVSQRNAVLAELGYGEGLHLPESSADKMMRSRARRRLHSLMGRASAGLSLQLRRLTDMSHAMFSSGDQAFQGIGCAACALFAAGAVLIPHASFQPVARVHDYRVAPATFSYGNIGAPLELGGAASRTLTPAGRDYLRRSTRARRSLTRAAPVAKTEAETGDQGTVPVPLNEEPPVDPPKPPPDLGRGTPKPLPLPRVPLVEKVVRDLRKVVRI